MKSAQAGSAPELGAVKRMAFDCGDASFQLAVGSYSFDIARQNISQGLIGGTVAANMQSATGGGRVSMFALNAAGARQLPEAGPNMDLVGRISIAQYRLGGFDETGSGASTQTNAALNLGSCTVLSVPVTLGLRFRFGSEDRARGASVLAGYRYDVAGAKSIAIAPQGNA